MALSAAWPDEDTARALSREQLGMAILFELPHVTESQRSKINFTNAAVARWKPDPGVSTTSVIMPGDGRQMREELEALVGSAWEWLLTAGYITSDPGGGRNSTFAVLTPGGQQVLALGRPRALDMAAQVAALNHPLHPRLRQVGVETLLRQGQLDHAVRDAFRDVEHAVRELANSSETSPVNLMLQAFDPATGPLRDPNASQTERNAQQRFFAGAFGKYRNAPNHTYTPYDDGEAIEIVLLANLLTRDLARVATRLNTRLDQISGPPT